MYLSGERSSKEIDERIDCRKARRGSGSIRMRMHNTLKIAFANDTNFLTLAD